MDFIQIHSVIPSFLSSSEITVSEIWGQEVCIRKGEYHLVSAVSGAGKSSLLSYIFGERVDYAGAIKFDDKLISTLTPSQWSSVRQSRIGFVFQGLRLFPELTAFENISLKNRLTGSKTDAEIMTMLESAGLGGKRDEKAARLSSDNNSAWL